METLEVRRPLTNVCRFYKTTYCRLNDYTQGYIQSPLVEKLRNSMTNQILTLSTHKFTLTEDAKIKLPPEKSKYTHENQKEIISPQYNKNREIIHTHRDTHTITQTSLPTKQQQNNRNHH